MKSPNDILNIAHSRLDEAKSLLNTGFYDGAFYLAGYSIELALKAKICTMLDIPNLFEDMSLLNDLTSFKTHNIKRLLLLAGLRKKLGIESSKNVTLRENWNLIINDWNENCRYLCCGTKSKAETLKLLDAIEDSKNGVLTWILNN